jgi:hypothetical protein
MKPRTKQKPACIASADIETLAREGVGRALAARGALTELSEELAGEVGGGRLIDQLKLIGPIRGGGMIGTTDIFSMEVQQ